LYKPIFLGLLADALTLTGKIEEGLAVLTEALVVAEAKKVCNIANRWFLDRILLPRSASR
jgi:hypothetical protein